MKAMVKGLCFSSSLLLATSLHAFWQKTYLAGVSSAIQASKGHLNTTMIYALPFFPTTVDIEEHSTKWIEGGALVGYQFQCEGWVIGAELSVDWHDNENYHFAFSDVFGFLGWSAQAIIQNSPIWGLTGRFAYVIAPYFIPFMRAGIELNKDDLSVTFSGDPRIFPVNFTIEEDKLEYGYLVGFGVEIPLPIKTCPLFRFEYNYHAFFHAEGGLRAQGMFDALLNLSGLSIPIDPYFTSDIHPISHSWKIALVWKFA